MKRVRAFLTTQDECRPKVQDPATYLHSLNSFDRLVSRPVSVNRTDKLLKINCKYCSICHYRDH